jgi:AP-3 complex subunit beta
VKKAFYSDEEDESGEEEADMWNDIQNTQTQIQNTHTQNTNTHNMRDVPEVGSLFTGDDTEGDLDPDHRLALKSSLPLLKSRNAAVVLAVCSLHFYCGTQSVATAQQIGIYIYVYMYIYPVLPI